jgi:translation initiation factor 1
VNDPKTTPAWSSEGAKPPAPPVPPAAGKPPAPVAPVRVRIERQGRGGKVVTVVDGLPGHPARIEEVAKTLKSRCGAGGTVAGRLVEIQGDHRDRVVALLLEMGLPAKRAGG